jgi:hypothetical protein
MAWFRAQENSTIKLILVLKSVGFLKNKSDPCLFLIFNGKELIQISIYVDDCFVIRKEERIQWLIVEFKRSGFNLKVDKYFKDYLSFHIIEVKAFNQIVIL